MAITWRNIDSDVTRGAAQLMEVARRSFNDGFGNLRGALDERNQGIKDQWNQTKEANTDAFLDRLAQFRTPEELAAAQQAGELQALRARFGNQIDRDAIRNAESTAEADLITRLTQRNQHADNLRMRNERGVRDELLGKLYAGDLKGFQQGLQDNQLLNEAEMAKEGYGIGKDQRAEGREDTRLGYEKTRLGFEGARVKLAQNADSRAAREFDDRMTQTLLGRANESLVAQSLDGVGSLNEGRQRYLAKAQEQGLPAQLQEVGLKRLESVYGGSTKLTEDDTRAVDAQVRNLDMEAASNEKLAQGLSVFSFPEPDKVTVDAVVADAIKRTPGEEDSTSGDILEVLNQFKKDHELPDSMNLGPVLKQAMQSIGMDEAMVGDDNLNLSTLRDSLDRVYSDLNRYQKLQDTARTSRATADARRRQLENEARLRNSLKNIR